MKPIAERICQEVENLYYNMKNDCNKISISTTLMLPVIDDTSYFYDIKIDNVVAKDGRVLYNIKIKNTWTRITFRNLDHQDMVNLDSLKAEIKIRIGK